MEYSGLSTCLAHCDLSSNWKHNIRITDKGVKFIDLEDSCVGPIDDRDRWNQMKMDEMQRLPDQLAEETGRGRPLTEVDV